MRHGGSGLDVLCSASRWRCELCVSSCPSCDILYLTYYTRDQSIGTTVSRELPASLEDGCASEAGVTTGGDECIADSCMKCVIGISDYVSRRERKGFPSLGVRGRVAPRQGESEWPRAPVCPSQEVSALRVCAASVFVFVCGGGARVLKSWTNPTSAKTPA